MCQNQELVFLPISISLIGTGPPCITIVDSKKEESINTFNRNE